MKRRERFTATVEAELLAAARRAVREGRAASVSAWVNDALARQADHDRRMGALDEFFRDYEAERGVITQEEIRELTRRTRARAIRVRSRRPGRSASVRRRRGAT